ncbi:DUF4350 domain-containing protein [Mycobacterium sp. 141]|uniref:DUF4350 domain-containing protein n=1 Tax=Mycobacterium sp. 141 TaxID=1120797 RepID=UPI00036DB158|nr:DUF4350 domain-containing protein [Mycobacterium sp. 141]
MTLHWRTARWVLLAVMAVVVVAAVSTYLTAPRPGGRLDPEATGPDGAHALVALLRQHGVEVITADTIGDVQRAAAPDTLVVAAQTLYLSDEDQLHQLAQAPGDLLLIAPVSKTREALAPKIKQGKASSFGGGDPDCDLVEATRSGDVELGLTNTFQPVDDAQVTSCYQGAVVRYQDGGRTVTVVGTGDFMANGGLLKAGNAALAMNLAGARSRVIWYAPQHPEGESTGGKGISALLPTQVRWVVLQLGLVVALLAMASARRLGPLVAESLPVVVRASETVEGRGRLYRSRRARDRAAEALRSATIMRLLPRLGLTTGAAPQTVAAAIAARAGGDTGVVGHTLFGPPPDTDSDLVHLAHQLDDIERQVAQS